MYDAWLANTRRVVTKWILDNCVFRVGLKNWKASRKASEISIKNNKC